MYKRASQLNLKFTTPVGIVSLQQLWTVSMNNLRSAVTDAHAVLKKVESTELDFLSDSTPVASEEETLTYEILKDVYITRREAAKAAQNAQERKEKEQKLLEILAEKQESSLRSKSKEEIEEMLRELKNEI